CRLVLAAFACVGGCAAPPAASVGPAGAAAAAMYVPERVRSAIDRGLVEPDETVRLVIGLRLRDEQSLSLRAAAAPPIPPAEFAERYAISAADYDAIVAWLVDSGLQVMRGAAGRTTITVEGSAVAVENALRVRLHRYEDAAGRFRAPDTGPVW